MPSVDNRRLNPGFSRFHKVERKLQYTAGSITCHVTGHDRKRLATGMMFSELVFTEGQYR